MRESPGSSYLIINIAAREQRAASVGELRENTARAPHVYAGRVELGSEQDVRWTVPEGDHLSTVAPHWDTEGPS